jgi:hypothetical protein
MVLMNAGSRARYTSSIVNQSQGGGSKKAGFPYEIGRSSWTTVAMHGRGLPATLDFMRKTVNPNVNQSRPIGRVVNRSYWGIY